MNKTTTNLERIRKNLERIRNMDDKAATLKRVQDVCERLGEAYADAEEKERLWAEARVADLEHAADVRERTVAEQRRMVAMLNKWMAEGQKLDKWPWG